MSPTQVVTDMTAYQKREMKMQNPEYVVRYLIGIYIKNGWVKSAREIDTGLCEDFALDLHAFLAGREDGKDTVDTKILDGFMGTDPSADDPDLIPPGYVDEFGRMPKSWKKGVGAPSHYWVWHKGMNYDAEAPQGVRNYFDLPIFKRQHAREMGKHANARSGTPLSMDEVIHAYPCVECGFPVVRLKYCPDWLEKYRKSYREANIEITGEEPFCFVHGLMLNIEQPNMYECPICKTWHKKGTKIYIQHLSKYQQHQRTSVKRNPNRKRVYDEFLKRWAQPQANGRSKELSPGAQKRQDWLNDRMRAYLKEQPRLKKLYARLLSFGGDALTPTYEEDLAKILKRGRLFKPPVKMMKGEPSQCHWNTARLWEANKGRVSIVTGWALDIDEDGLGAWKQHTWGYWTSKDKVVETTVKRALYYGFILTEREAERFYSENMR